MLGAWIHEFILLPMVKKTPPNLLLLMLGSKRKPIGWQKPSQAILGPLKEGRGSEQPRPSEPTSYPACPVGLPVWIRSCSFYMMVVNQQGDEDHRAQDVHVKRYPALLGA